MSTLSIRGLRSGYGKIEVLHDRHPRRRAGRDRYAHRRERRRQDDAAQDNLRPAATERR